MLVGLAAALFVVLFVLLLRQHRAWVVAAEEAVLVNERPGAFAAAVAEAQGPGVRTPVPPIPVVGSVLSPGGGLSQGSPDKPQLRGRFGTASDNIAVAAAVGVAGLVDWWQVDENVLKAVEAWTHEHIGNTLDLWSAVQEHKYELDKGLFISLRGHVGEQMAADHLAAAGLNVSLPEASNQPGWDLDVDGQLVNVKVTADAGKTLAEHFERYPDIPVLINADAGNIPPDAIWFDPSEGLDASVLVGEHVTLVDHALSLHDAAASVHDAFGADVDVDVPIVGVLITVARSGTREAKLVRDGHTDVERALKNVAIDTAARGGGVIVGGLAGAKVGAWVDVATFGFTMGLGTVLGGLLGAAGGAMAGSATASHVRLAPLRDAWQRLQRDLSGYERAIESQQKIVTAKVAASEQRAQQKLERRRATAQERLAADLKRLRREVEEASTFDAARVLEQGFADLERRSGMLPDDLVARRRAAPSLYLRWALRRRIAKLRERANRLAGPAQDGGPDAEEFWDIVACSANGDATLAAHVANRVAAQRSVHRRAVGRAVAEVAVFQQARNAARQEALAVFYEARAEAVTRLEREAGRLQTSVAGFEREALAAGRSAQK